MSTTFSYTEGHQLKLEDFGYFTPERRAMLASVKEGLYHPHLPTFRRMDMDTANHKLSDEHVRNTTTCGPVDFKGATVTLVKQPDRRLAGFKITDTGRSVRSYQPTVTSMDYNNKIESDFEKPRPTHRNEKEMGFTGYAVRYLSPHITGSWQYMLRQDPVLDQQGYPKKYNPYSRYRDTYPQYSRNVAQETWR